ncbi:MAG TPA: ribosome maturation factor RimM [Chthonomonadales bacterium]|nr:ribosome maturation factor RimM [Chthonomonadales bacterium]
MVLEEWRLTIGHVAAPFGRLGEVRVRPDTDFPDRFLKLRHICLRPPGGEARLMHVESARPHKGNILLKLRGIESIDDAETLRDAVVQIRSEEAVALPQNEYYIHDLIGCKVVCDSGRALGTLTTVLQGRANDVYVIGRGKEEILLPAVREVVKEVDLPGRRIVVSPAPGTVPDE